MKKKKAEAPMRTMTKETKKEGPRLKGKGRADAKASRQLLLLCIPAIIGYTGALFLKWRLIYETNL